MSIVPINKHALALQRADAEQALERFKSIVCSTPEAAQFFEEAMAMAHKAVKALEDERTTLTKPLQDEVKSIQAEFKPVENAFAALKDISKQKVSEYRTQVALRAAEARERAVLAAQAGNTQECAVALAEVPDEVSSSFEWGFTVTNLSQVDRKFLMLDERAVKQHLAPLKNSDSISAEPGLEFFKRAVVRVGRAK
jgi:hypothetical protein